MPTQLTRFREKLIWSQIGHFQGGNVVQFHNGGVILCFVLTLMTFGALCVYTDEEQDYCITETDVYEPLKLLRNFQTVWKSDSNLWDIATADFFKESNFCIPKTTGDQRHRRPRAIVISWQNIHLFKFRQKEIHIVVLCAVIEHLCFCTVYTSLCTIQYIISLSYVRKMTHYHPIE